MDTYLRENYDEYDEVGDKIDTYMLQDQQGTGQNELKI